LTIPHCLSRAIAVCCLKQIQLRRKGVRNLFSAYSRNGDNTGWEGDAADQEYYIYDGWNIVMTLDGNGEKNGVFTWGLDLSGSVHGAGGIGGLLAMTTCSINVNEGASYWYLYDGNGNVGQVLATIKDENGDITGVQTNLAARYEYDPYGNAIVAAGDWAAYNTIRFSTKWFDDETGLGYWGYRYYNPKLGRWVSRDPIGEVFAGHIPHYYHNNHAYTTNSDNTGTSIDDTTLLIQSYSSMLPKANTLNEAWIQLLIGNELNKEDYKEQLRLIAVNSAYLCLYKYVGNNPENAVDLYGLLHWDPFPKPVPQPPSEPPGLPPNEPPSEPSPGWSERTKDYNCRSIRYRCFGTCSCSWKGGSGSLIVLMNIYMPICCSMSCSCSAEFTGPHSQPGSMQRCMNSMIRYYKETGNCRCN